MFDCVLWLKVWLIILVGYDNFDVVDFICCGIVFVYMFDVLIEFMVDMVFLLIFVFVCCVVELVEWVKVGYWYCSIGLDLYGIDV